MRIRKLVKLFLSHCRECRKPNTVRSYESRMKPILESLGEQKLASIRLSDIESHLHRADRREDGSLKAADTRRANAVAVQKLFAFAVDRGLLDEPPFKKLEKPPPRRRERIPTAAEDAAVEALSPPAFRLILRALRQSGARPSEIAGAQVSDYDREKRLIILREHKTSYTGKPRKIGVGAKLAAILVEAMGERTEGPLFVDVKGRAWTPQRLSKLYKRLCRRAKLSEELCLYMQRHAHATELCEKVGVHAASQALGHSNIQTTMRYVHTNDALLAKNQDLVGLDGAEPPPDAKTL